MESSRKMTKIRCVGEDAPCPLCAVGIPVKKFYGFHSIFDKCDNKWKQLQCTGPDKCMVCKKIKEVKMMDKDKKEFGSWWMWVLLLTVLSLVILAGLRYAGVVGERVIFTNSYQYTEARKTEIAIFEAQLVEINTKLRSDILEANLRTNLEAQAAAIRIQLNAARSR